MDALIRPNSERHEPFKTQLKLIGRSNADAARDKSIISWSQRAHYVYWRVIGWTKVFDQPRSVTGQENADNNVFIQRLWSAEDGCISQLSKRSVFNAWVFKVLRRKRRESYAPNSSKTSWKYDKQRRQGDQSACYCWTTAQTRQAVKWGKVCDKQSFNEVWIFS